MDNPGSDSSSSVEVESEPFDIEKHDILYSKSARYLIVDFNGEGCFGKVAKCINLETLETTAIKIHHQCDSDTIEREVAMLQELSPLDPESNNLVEYKGHFMHQEKSCLAFEMLDRSLMDLVEEKGAPLSLNEIRPIAQQLLVAFEALKGVGIIHSDLKPDNVMLVNQQDQPLRVKLIDFGLAFPANEAVPGMLLQAPVYRAPEVFLGLPFSEAIDMWGLGCVLAFLYSGYDIFLADSTVNIMEAICKLCGQPGDDLLNAGKYTRQFFTRGGSSTNPGWRLKTKGECINEYGDEPPSRKLVFDTGRNTERVGGQSKKGDNIESRDEMAFLSLLQQLLNVEPASRITPGDALQHCFITMAHLKEEMETSSYAETAFELMAVCPPHDSNDSDGSDDSNDLVGSDGSDDSGDSDGSDNPDDSNDSGGSYGWFRRFRRFRWFRRG